MKTLSAFIFLLCALAILGPAIDTPGAADVAVAEHRNQIKVLRAAIDMCGGHEAVALADGAFQCVKTTNAGVSK
jgi:hypothetical protein